MNEFKKSMGNRLKSLREKRGLKQNRVAQMLGVHNSTLAKYESGEREADNETLTKLADIYEVSVNYLLTGNREQKEIPDNLNLPIFSRRLSEGIKQKEIPIEKLAKECNVTQEYIQELMTSPKRLPGATTLLNLAMLLDVTPDYLGGFTDEPQGYSPLTPKPKDLKLVLEEEEVVFDGAPLSEDDKEMILGVINALNIKAKKMNKRKKGRD